MSGTARRTNAEQRKRLRAFTVVGDILDPPPPRAPCQGWLSYFMVPNPNRGIIDRDAYVEHRAYDDGTVRHQGDSRCLSGNGLDLARRRILDQSRARQREGVSRVSAHAATLSRDLRRVPLCLLRKGYVLGKGRLDQS